MKHKGTHDDELDLATIEQVNGILSYFDGGAAKNALSLGGVKASLYALKTDVSDAIAELVGGAPEALDTLYEISKVLQDNVAEIDTILTQIGTKAEQSDLDDATDRITTLENSATQVSFSPSLTSGTKIGSITIDNTTTNLYAPSLSGYATEAWTTANFLTDITGEMVKDALGYTPASEAWTTANFLTDITDTMVTEALGYTPASEEWMSNNFYNGGEIDAMLADYLPLTGGTIGYLDVEGALSAVVVNAETINTDAIKLSSGSSFNIGEDNLMIFGQGNEMYGNQGGIYVTTTGSTIYLTSVTGIVLNAGENSLTVSADGLYTSGGIDVEGDATIGGAISVGGDIEWIQNCYIGITQDESLAVYGNMDIILNPVIGGVVVNGELDMGTHPIRVSKLYSQSFLFSTPQDTAMDIGINDATLNRDFTINGDLVVTGNIVAHGTVASGGVAQPTESDLSALEARIAALEEIING